jgi:hypothetical protein
MFVMTDEPMLGRFKCTAEMAAMNDFTQKEGHEIFEMLCDLAYRAYSTRFDKGCQNGAIRVMSDQYQSYFFAAQALSMTFTDGPNRGRDFFPFMVMRNHNARAGMGLPGWMQRLIDRNGGVIPRTWENSDVMSDEDIALEQGVVPPEEEEDEEEVEDMYEGQRD